MSDRLHRFLGDTPLRVLIRLVILSFVVGLVLSALNIRPLEIYSWIERIIENVWAMGFEFFGEALDYLWVGALIVVPLFLLMRLFSMGGGGRRRSD